MTENIEPRELPHQLLMRRYSIGVNDLKPHARQLKKDLDKTLQLVINKSKGGAIRLTPATQSKIEAYDRYICDGVFEILEIKESAEEKREELVEQMEELHEEAKEEAISGIDKELQAKDNENNPQVINQEETIEKEETETEPEPKSEGVRVGFWNWK